MKKVIIFVSLIASLVFFAPVHAGIEGDIDHCIQGLNHTGGYTPDNCDVVQVRTTTLLGDTTVTIYSLGYMIKIMGGASGITHFINRNQIFLQGTIIFLITFGIGLSLFNRRH